jgi:hypothetical protein
MVSSGKQFHFCVLLNYKQGNQSCGAKPEQKKLTLVDVYAKTKGDTVDQN